jgi:hypothetical protein
VKRGLVASIAAHAAFNGVLTVAALAVVLAPTKTITAGLVSVDAPSGWSRPAGPTAALVLTGPSGSMLAVAPVPTVGVPDPSDVVSRIDNGTLSATLPGIVVDTASTREVTVPAGRAVEVDVTARGHHGTLVFLPHPGESYEVVFFSAGSAKAQRDFPEMLRSLRIG